MTNFWDSEVWGPVTLTAALLLALLAANGLKRSVGILRRSLIPTSVLAGMLLLILAVFTLQYMTDDTFKTAEDIEKEFGVMPLSVIPEGKIEGMESTADMSRKELKALRQRSKRTGKKDEKYGRSKK